MKKRKRKWKGLSFIFTVLLIGFLWYLGSFTVEMIKVRHDKRQAIVKNHETIARMKKDIENLEQEMKKSDTMDYVEKVAREELGMVKPREIIFIDKNKDSEKLYKTKTFE